MERYTTTQLDQSTFVVIDQIEKREICVCSDYDDWDDAQNRAARIASLLNQNIEQTHH